ncbi:MAG: sugar phosphate isomerase/epimerase [Planctomycetota bacterium]|nr:MAG: sugar phosphate isomerase/epimerase [Planctomycetota bacterium]
MGQPQIIISPMNKRSLNSPLQASMCSIGFQREGKWAPSPSVEIPLPEVIRIVAEHGFSGIEIWQPHWECLDTSGRLRALRLLQRHALQVPMLSAYYNFTKSEAHAADSLAKGHQVIAQAAELGAANIRIFTGNHRSADASPEQWQRTRRCLQELCDAAAPLGIGLCLETHDWNLMDTVPGTLRLLELVERPNLGLIFQASTFGPSTWYWALGHLLPWVRHVHAPPKKCGLAGDPHDFRTQLSTLLDHGFSGFVSLEYMGPDPWLAARSDGQWLISCCRQLSAASSATP